MSAALLPNVSLTETFEARTPGSAALSQQARGLLPSGIAHDARRMDPYPVYIDRAKGPLKWDVDGNEYVDYFGGHGALLLGHNHPAVLAAMHAQLDRGTHYGACHTLEVEWAAQVCRMVPSAQRVRFTSSGTEATLMALRLARAATGRTKLLRFRGHFHGWHDHMTSGHTTHMDGTPTNGVLPGIADQVLLADPNDEAGVTRLFEAHKDIAAVILEPTGANFGKMPIRPSFLALLRQLTAQAGALLVFDEVVTGFRVAPGGVQAATGITPDLTTLAKILAGGLPGGAVAGRKDLLDLLDFDAAKRAGAEKIPHPGTFNANPLSAAAGLAALRIIETTYACERANAYAGALRTRMNQVLAEERVPWAVYGTYSGFHIHTGPGADPLDVDPYPHIPAMLAAPRTGGVAPKLRMGLMANGIDINGSLSGLISATHGEAQMDTTVTAFRTTLRALRRDGDLAAR